MSDRRRHLSTTTWERLACGELRRAEEDAARAHIAACDDCGATWAALVDVRAAAEAFDPGLREPLPEPLTLPEPRTAPEPRWPRFRRPALRATLAAAAVLVAVLGVSRWQQQPAFSPAAPFVPADSERSGTSLRPRPELPGEGAVGDVNRFSWVGSPAVERYAVEILDGAGAMLWRSDETSRLDVPWPDQIEKVPGTYYWRVVAADDGHSVSSELVRFELVP